jgi:hypothetical protein
MTHHDSFSVIWTKLFMNSVRESYSQIIVKQVLEHIKTKNPNSESSVVEGILRCVSSICVIPDTNSLGSIVQDLFVTISGSVGGIEPNESLASQYIETSGVITKDLQNFIQIEVLAQLMSAVAENSVDSAKSAILLEIMTHSTGFFKPTKETESAILQDFVKPIIEVQ